MMLLSIGESRSQQSEKASRSRRRSKQQATKLLADKQAIREKPCQWLICEQIMRRPKPQNPTKGSPWRGRSPSGTPELGSETKNSPTVVRQVSQILPAGGHSKSPRVRVI